MHLGDPAIARVPVIALRARDVLDKPASLDDLCVAIEDCGGPGERVA